MRRTGRISIALLVVLVAVAAVDLGWWRYVTSFSPGINPIKSLLGFRGPYLDVGVMPMASVLAVGLTYWLTNRSRASRRVVGFLRGGAVGLFLYLSYSWACLVLPYDLVYGSMKPIYWARGWFRSHSLEPDLYLCYANIVYYATPQFLLALIGSVMAAKRAPVEDSSPDFRDVELPRDDR